jgi:hypothetical protein
MLVKVPVVVKEVAMKKLILALAAVAVLGTGLMVFSSAGHEPIPAAYACDNSGCN